MPDDPTHGVENIPVWDDGVRLLTDDPVFGPWIDHIGPIEIPRSDEEPFYYLTRAICYQQLAGAAARTIHGRVLDVLDGDVRPGVVLETPDDDLRGAGLSRSKLAAIRDLAMKIDSGDVPVDGLDDLDDDAVVERLTCVRGIGEWTAQMYLMFRLRRPDVWPVGDLGVRQGYAKAHGLDPAPAARELRPMGEAYRPWRSAAAFYCWRILENDLP